MTEQKLIDHLFRYQYGKMVSILTRIFGLSQLEVIEDAIQDTFIKAMMVWRNQKPENPEAWLTQAAKYRAIDLLRKNQAEQERINHMENGPSFMAINDLFLEHEIEDSQLRMIFTACHPILDPKDQIAFALKTISGFGVNEIATALLLKEETVKKRLNRAKKVIVKKKISFEIPDKKDVPERLNRVLEVIYLTFNEGFHSAGKQFLVRQELCGEAIRLCKLLLKKESLRLASVYALFALMCFHAARLESRINEAGDVIDLKEQDRTKWYFPLIWLGNDAMNKAIEIGEGHNSYFYEAAIAAEHLKAKSFESTNWQKILYWYDKLYEIHRSPFALLNKSIVLIQLKLYNEAKIILDNIEAETFENRKYLYYCTLAEYHTKRDEESLAAAYFDRAIELVNNKTEKEYLIRKKEATIDLIK